MPDRKYKIIFRGDIAASADIDVVKQQLIKALKASPEFVNSMFSHSETCIKSQLRQELAQKIKDHLQRTGARFIIVPEPSSHAVTHTLSETMMKSGKITNTRQKKKRSYILPTLFLVLFSLVFGIKFWASQEAHHIRGPSHIVKNNQHLYTISHRHLLQLHATTGKLLINVALTDLGILGDVSDIQIDEQGQVWLGDIQEQRILRCDLTTRKCTNKVQLTFEQSISKKAKYLPENFEGITPVQAKFNFKVVPEMDHIYVSETSLNRMRMFDMHGKELFVDDTHVMLPSKMIWENEQILLADWGNQRVVLLDKYDLSFKDEWIISNLSALSHDDDHNLNHDEAYDDHYDEDFDDPALEIDKGLTESYAPIQVRPDTHGGHWLLCSNLLLTDFQLLHLNQKQQIIGSYPVEASSPSALELLNNSHILLANEASFQLMQVDAHGQPTIDFGANDVLQLFSKHQQQKEFYNSVSTAMLYALLLLFIAAIATYCIQKRQH